ncbi:MAG TPA: hypothetical protein DCZ72_09655 [Armatimonadetes bacterium]|nr:hypothetical protein [Armatimonadota bacterium]
MATVVQSRLTPADRAIAEDAARLVRARWAEAEVYVFGSRARGEARPDSDLDLLVLTPARLGWRERSPLLDDLMRLSVSSGVFVEAVFVSTAAWDSGGTVSDLLRADIKRDGVAV